MGSIHKKKGDQKSRDTATLSTKSQLIGRCDRPEFGWADGGEDEDVEGGEGDDGS